MPILRLVLPAAVMFVVVVVRCQSAAATMHHQRSSYRIVGNDLGRTDPKLEHLKSFMKGVMTLLLSISSMDNYVALRI